MIEQLSNESRSIIFIKNIRISLERLFFNFGDKFFKDNFKLESKIMTHTTEKAEKSF